MAPPGLFQVELTNYCNLNCAMCARSSGMKRPLGHMDINLFREIVDQSVSQNMPIHWFHHFGEPLMYKHFREAMTYFRQKGLGRGSISTNAVLLNDDKIDILLENCSYVLCCVDSSLPDAYAQIRGNTHHDRVCDNVARFIAERNKRNADCEIVIQFLRTKHNQEEDVTGLVNLFGIHPKVRYIEKRLDKHPNGADLRMFSNPADYSAKLQCHMSRDQLCILWNGDCVPCCWDSDGEQSIGNISQEALCQIWQGTKHRAFQKRLAEARFDELPVCKNCPGPVTDYDFAYTETINSWVDTWKRAGSKVVIAPGSPRMASLLKTTRLRESNIVAFCDANPRLHGTSMEGIPVKPYDAIEALHPDVIFIYSALHGAAIYDSLKRYQNMGIGISQLAGPLD